MTWKFILGLRSYISVNPCLFCFLLPLNWQFAFYICVFTACVVSLNFNSSSLYNDLDSDYSRYLMEHEARLLHWDFTVMFLLLSHFNFALVTADKKRVYIVMESTRVVDYLQDDNHWPRTFICSTDVDMLLVF